MRGNSYLPLLLFAALLGVFLPIAIGFRRREIPSGNAGRWGVGVAIALIAGFLVMACAYALSASFSDHFEPSIALGAERVLAGEQAFSDPNGAAQYASIYGPNAYLFNSLWVALWPEVIAGSKLAGAAAAFAFCALFMRVCMRRNGIGVASMQLALVLGLCLLFEQFGYWNRPEPLQLFGVALSIAALTFRSRWASAVALGIAIALLVNLKVHSLLYAFPVTVELLYRRQWRVLFIAAVIASAGIIAPFIFTDLFSLQNYLLSLRGATKHSWSLEMFAGNICALLFFAAPTLALLYRPTKSGDPVSVADEQDPSKWYLMALAFVSLLACIIGSKLGAGPQHLIPLLPHLAWVMAGPFRRFLQTVTLRPMIAAAASAWIIALLICTGLSQQVVAIQIGHDPGRIVIDDLRAVRASFPESSIQMGCGSSRWWFLYWYRPELRAHDPVDFIDITAWMDMQHAGRSFSERTLDTLRDEKFDIWLIPKASEPFTQISYYPPFKNIFDSEFRDAFASGYRLAGRTRCFDIYLARRLSALPVRR